MAQTTEQPLTPTAGEGAEFHKQIQHQSEIAHHENSVQDAESLTRLLDETNAQMGTPDTKIRRNMISQLRSAFIETKTGKAIPRPDREIPDTRRETGVTQSAELLNLTPAKTYTLEANRKSELKSNLTVRNYKNTQSQLEPKSLLEPRSKPEPLSQPEPQPQPQPKLKPQSPVITEPNVQPSTLPTSVPEDVLEITLICSSPISLRPWRSARLEICWKLRRPI